MILVTGGTGLVGSHLLYKLMEKGEHVRALYRSKNRLAAVKRVFSFFSADAELLFNKIEWIEADITDLPALSEAFVGITYVYHCAAVVSFDRRDDRKLRKINIEGTANVVNLCLEGQVKKLCHVSSVAALGEDPGELITEGTHWNADADNSMYAITKYGAELEVWRGAQEGLEVVVVNPGIILGPGFPDSGSGAIFGRIKHGLRYYTRGVTGYVSVEDVADGMIALMESAIVNKRYILVAENRSYGEVFTAIAGALEVKPPVRELKSWQLKLLWRLDWLRSKLTGKDRALTKAMARSAIGVQRYSSEAIKKELGFVFTPLSETIRRTVSWG